MKNYLADSFPLALALILPAAGLLVCCASAGPEGQASLKAAFKNDFLIGAALNENQFTGVWTKWAGR